CHDDAETEAMMSELAREERAGLLVLPENFVIVHRHAIITLAARYRLPAVYPYRFFTTSGGLMSYGIDPNELFRRAASYVDRILKGAKPTDMPVQNPDKFELVINLKAAQALGITVAPSLLTTADEVMFEVRCPVFESNVNWNISSLPSVQTKTNLLLSSVRIECALRPTGITCNGSRVTRLSSAASLTDIRLEPYNARRRCGQVVKIRMTGKLDA